MPRFARQSRRAKKKGDLGEGIFARLLGLCPKIFWRGYKIKKEGGGWR